jgi:hypothetical protein
MARAARAAFRTAAVTAAGVLRGSRERDEEHREETSADRRGRAIAGYTAASLRGRCSPIVTLGNRLGAIRRRPRMRTDPRIPPSTMRPHARPQFFRTATARPALLLGTFGECRKR